MANKARILFVDDEKRVLNSMRGLFRREYELFLTCEGAEAIQIAAENEIDVVGFCQLDRRLAAFVIAIEIENSEFRQNIAVGENIENTGNGHIVC